MPLGVALFLFILGRGRRMDNRGIDKDAGGDFHAAIFQIRIHRVENFFTQTVLFQ